MTESVENAKMDSESRDFVAETESGARNPTGSFPKKVLFAVPLIWTLFQLWYQNISIHYGMS